MIGTQRVVPLPGGRQATVEIIGTGPPVFWFEGGPGLPARLSRPEAELLSDHFSVYLIDPHGSGGSTPPSDPSQYGHVGHARFYEEVRNALGVGRVTIAGISFGGSVALTYTALYPDLTVRCIAVSAGGVGADVDEGDAAAEMERMLTRHTGAEWYPEARKLWDEWTDRVLAATDAVEVKEMFGKVFPLYCAHPDRPDVRARLEWARGQLDIDLGAAKVWEGGLYQTFDLRPLLSKVTRPTLVVCGELDLICGPAQARQIAAGVPGATLVVIPNCGHIPGWEAPHEFRTAVLDWSRAN